MQPNQEMTKFIIENVELIEQASAILEDVDSQLITSMGNYAKNILEKTDIFDLIKTDEGDLWFTSSRWEKNEKDEPLLKFWLDCHGTNTDKTWISVLGGKAPGAVAGIYCWYDWGTKGIKRKAWKDFLRNFFLKHESFYEQGFILNDEGTAILKPFNLSLDCLKEHFLSPDKCFEPLADVIDTIISQIKVFDELLKNSSKLE